MLKYLLITIMALSLLAVSCTKDGTPPPTPTNPITIDAATLDSAIKKALEEDEFTDIDKFDFSSFKSANGKADFKVVVKEVEKAKKVNNMDTLKEELESAFLSFSSDGFTATAEVTMPAGNPFDPIKVVIEIDAGNNTFADDVKTAYTVKDKKATVVITIKPNEKWDGKNDNKNYLISQK